MKFSFLDKNHLKLFLWFFGTIFYFESIVRLFQGAPYLGIGLFFLVMFGAALAALFTALCSFLPSKGGFALALVFLVLVSAVYLIQLFYFFMFSTYLTIFSIINGMAALGFGGNIWATLAQKWPYMLLMFVPLVLFIIFGRKIWLACNWRGALFVLAVAFVLHFGTQGLLLAFGTGYFTPYDYYTVNTSLNQSVDKLGLYTTFRLNVQRYLFGEDSTRLAYPPAPSASPVPTPPPEATPTSSAASQSTEKVPEEYGYNVLDIDFDALMNAVEDEDTRAMHQYFAGVPPTQKNDHTGMFEGYNLITVTAESFAPYAVDKTLTPTLYKMYNEGFQFTNFYAPEWEVSTSDGEYVNCLGLIPKHGVWSMYLSGKHENELPFALGNQFLEKGYQTFAYHNNTYTYYNRDLSHPNMGYTYKGLGNGLEVDQTWPESDVQMVDLSTPDYLNGQPFHVYYLTVSGHMAYNYDGNDMSRKNWDLVKDLPLSDEAKAYLACNIELDRAMELLLARLEEAGVAEKTVIALSPDHPPYGLERDTVSELLGHEVDMSFEYSKNMFLLYNPGMEPETVEEPCCSLDILPTLSNLFGLPYDSRLLMGRDIFSDAEPLAILADRSFVTERFAFNANTGEVIPTDGNEVGQEEIAAVQQMVMDKFAWSPKMLDQDYYRLVFEDGGG